MKIFGDPENIPYSWQTERSPRDLLKPRKLVEHVQQAWRDVKMRGVIETYDASMQRGTIAGPNGLRYAFKAGGVKVGDKVQFDWAGGNPIVGVRARQAVNVQTVTA